MGHVLVALLLALWPGTAAAQASSPGQVAEAMRTCLSIERIEPDPVAPTAEVRVVSSDAPRLVSLPLVEPDDLTSPRTDLVDLAFPDEVDEVGELASFLLLVAPSGVNAPNLEHPRHPGLRAVFERYPVPVRVTVDASQALERYQDRVVACFLQTP